MGTWVNTSRVWALLDEDEVARLSRDDSTASINLITVSACIEDAEGEFLSAALSVGTQPAASSKAARTYCTTLAVRNLYNRKSGALPDEWARRVDDWTRYRDSLINGRAHIDAQERYEADYGVRYNEDSDGDTMVDY